MKTRQYVALVPSWLTNAIHDDVSAATDLYKLSAIVSHKDVCFYALLQQHISKYLGTTFDDMEPITKAPRNDAWVVENAKSMADNKLLFDIYIKGLDDPRYLEEKKLKLPSCYNKSDYRPEMHDGVLLLLGTGDANQYDNARFLKSVIKTMHHHLTVEEYQQFDVFKFYTQSA
jgi:hypothetical protein